MKIDELAVTDLPLGRILHISQMSPELRAAHAEAWAGIEALQEEIAIITDGLRSAVEAELSPINADELHYSKAVAERDANARLIASAPRLLEERDALLEALQSIIREPQGKTINDNPQVLAAIMRTARNAIAKATGEKPCRAVEKSTAEIGPRITGGL